MRKLVGDNCARIRRAQGMTQEQLAERSGLTQQYLSDLERGKRNPTILTLYEIAQALQVSHVELVPPQQDLGGAQSRAPTRS
ncbi:MAG: helix-turn-helix transcriptional regulator [Croceibacterium sp.]